MTIVHEPPLARALYRDVEIGQTIPEEFFAAVAEVLAFVFRTARRSRGASSPERPCLFGTCPGTVPGRSEGPPGTGRDAPRLPRSR